MWIIARFRGKTEARSPGPVELPVRLLAERITPLDDKTRNDPVKSRPIVKLHFSQVAEILDVAGSKVREKADFNIPIFGRDNRFWVFFLKG